MQYNVTVIGSGPGGYVAAIRCAQLGMKVAIIEKYDTLGGTCLNVGCIPSKAMLDSSEHYHNAAHTFKEHGIEISEPKANISQMIKRKGDVVKSNVDGIAFLMKKNKIDVHTGVGSFVDKNTIKVTSKGGKESTLTTEKVIIATGSKPTPLPFAPFDKKRIISSTEALELKEIPKHLIVIGGGVIGMELGSVYARIGSKVSVVEFLDSLIPTMDGTLGKELQKSTKKLGIDFYLGHKVTAVERRKFEGRADPGLGFVAAQFEPSASEHAPVAGQLEAGIVGRRSEPVAQLDGDLPAADDLDRYAAQLDQQLGDRIGCARGFGVRLHDGVAR
jgi:dihydrolipoamide dehydrogenase